MLKRLRMRHFSLRRRRKSVRNLKASAAAEKRNSDGKLKNLLKKREFEIISLDPSIFSHIMHVFCRKLGPLKRKQLNLFIDDGESNRQGTHTLKREACAS